MYPIYNILILVYTLFTNVFIFSGSIYINIYIYIYALYGCVAHLATDRDTQVYL